MNNIQFPISVIEQIGYYVYSLVDPITDKVFYVGKGTENRVFAHATEALESPIENDKVDRIRQIRESGAEVKYEIIRHGLTEKEAYEVESALIDFIGLSGLTNKVAGHAMDSRGRMTVAEIIATYEADPITITEPVLLIIVNRLFERNINPDRLYEITRGNWVLGERRNKVKYAFSVYRGIVREVYRVNGWSPAPARSLSQKRQARWRFDGEVAQEQRHLIGGSVKVYLKAGAQSPVKYVNC